MRVRQPLSRPQRRHRRDGFTLVELLVAITIFVILATLAIGAYQGNQSDRVGASSATFKNALEGARSRAIAAGEPRGLRLLVDRNDGRICTSVTYIGSNGFLEGTLDVTPSGFSDFRFGLTNDTSGEWGPLRASGGRELIGVGNRIEIPARSGNWYTVVRAPANDSDNTMLVRGAWPFSRTQDVTYRLELAPTVLPGADPIVLTPQTCIDLDGSIIPDSWRPSSGSGTSADYGQMDILFSPRGVVHGALQTEGVLHFRVAYVSDVVLEKGLSGRPVNSGDAAVVPADPEKDHKAVTLFTQTGQTLISLINVGSGDTDGTFNNETVGSASAYFFATSGKEAK